MRSPMATVCLCLLAAGCALAQPENLCPNPGAEVAGEGGRPAAWLGSVGNSEWATDEIHSGERSLKLAAAQEGTWSWTSDPIFLGDGPRSLAVSLWSRLDGVTGGGGAMVVVYHCDDAGERIEGGGGILSLGGAGEFVATRGWQQDVGFAEIPADVPTIRINLRLNSAAGSAWFDDIDLFAYAQGPLSAPRPLRRGIRLDGVGIVSCEGGDKPAGRILHALEQAGHPVELLAHDAVDFDAGERDLIVLGNLATSRAVEHLYLNYYTYEDRYYPGGGGWVLRPLVDPLGTGANILVVGASDEAGLQVGVERLLAAIAEAGAVLDLPLTVQIGEGWLGMRNYPWPGPGPYRAMVPAGEYLKTGDLEAAQAYRDYVFATWFTETDGSYADRQNTLHLIYHSRTMSWDLMDSCPVFSDEERLRIDNELLRLLRSNQGYGYAGLTSARYARGNHDIRNARSFYFGWRHFRKYYEPDLRPDLIAWTRKLEDFFGLVFSSWRTADEALSQHAVGGSHNCVLDVAFMQPQWASQFFADGYDRMMGDKAIACCNNLGQMVMLGDTNPTDYPSAIFAKLAWRHRDGRYQFMIDRRGMTQSTGDEAMRAFAVGVEPQVPVDHIGLRIFPLDDLILTMIRTHPGVDQSNGFDKISFREGFDPADEYMLVDGISGAGHAYEDANTIGEFSAHGRRWLLEFDRFNAPSASFHNAVTVARNGLGAAEIPYAAELLDSASGDGWAWTATRLPHYNGVGWTRHIAWFPGAYTFVLDDLAAEEPGDYSFVLGWRSVGYPAMRPGVFSAAQDEPEPGLLAFDGKALADAVTSTSGRVFSHKALTNTLFLGAGAEGDFIEMALTMPRDGDFEVLLTPQRHPQRGVVQLAIDGADVGAPVPLFGEESAADAPVSVGRLRLTAGEHAVRLTVVGANPEGTSWLVALRRLALRSGEPGDTDLEAARSRFFLGFPADVPATLDRDTEVMGPGLPEEPWRDQALNIVEQSMARRMAPGETACFVNAFCAQQGADVTGLELRRLSDRCALVRRGDDVALVGVAMAEPVEVGGLRLRGTLARVGAAGVRLHEAQATLDGRALESGAPPDADALRALLRRAWEEAGGEAAVAATPWEDLPRMAEEWSAELPSRPLALQVRGTDVAIGTEDGRVIVFTGTGAPVGEFATDGPVHALAAADLDGDGTPELLVGSDDEHVYALDADLSERWRTKLPFLGTQALFWSLYRSKVRALVADDLDGDGTPEVYAGAGDMNVHALDAEGGPTWHHECQWGVPSTLRVTEGLGDRKLLLAGNGLTSYAGRSWALDAGGHVAYEWRGLKSAAVQDAVAADLDADGVPTVFTGTARGDLYAWVPDASYPNWSWVRNFTRPVRTLTVLPTRPGLVAVGADSGTLAAFDEAGEMAWNLSLGGAVTHTALARHGGETLLAVGRRTGEVFLVTLDGALRAWFDAEGTLQEMTVADLDGDGDDEIIVATDAPGRVTLIGTR